ncbi:MAG: hypothetical protein ACSHWN_12355 [Methylophilaceae bacterium]
MDIEINTSASTDDIAILQGYVKNRFNNRMPEDYEDFLKQSDGVQIENVYFFSALDVTLLNEDFSYKDKIRIGDKGNIDDLVFSFHSSRYEVITMGHADEVIATFNDIQSLINYLKKEQSV